VPSVTPKYAVDVLPNGAYTNYSLVSSNANLRIDPNYRDPFTNEYIVQVERALTTDLGLQANYVYKSGSDYPGWEDITGRYADVAYIDSRGAGATGNTYTVYKLLTPASQSVFLMTNAVGLQGETLFNKYHGVTMTATKRMSHRWQGTFSLVLSKSEGRLPSSTSGPRSSQSATPASFGRFNNGPNDFVNTDGLLIGDRPVVGKMQIVYGLPWDITISGNVQHQTGRPWARQIRVSGLGFTTNPTIYVEPLDGSRRVPNLNLFDMRVQKSFRIPNSPARADVYVDFLNLTNSDATENLGSRLGTSSSFGLPTSYILPRRAMIGVRMRF
jgi:hypothetical protein